MRSTIVPVVVCLAVVVAVMGQSVQQPAAPRTRLESLLKQDGVLIVKGSSKIGELAGGAIAIEVREFREVSTGKRELGISVELSDSMGPRTQHASYVDYDEMNALLAAIDYFSKVNGSCTSLDQYQAVYRTRGGLELSIRSIRSGEGLKVSSTDEAGQAFSVFLNPADMPALRDLIATARAKLEALPR